MTVPWLGPDAEADLLEAIRRLDARDDAAAREHHRLAAAGHITPDTCDRCSGASCPACRICYCPLPECRRKRTRG